MIGVLLHAKAFMAVGNNGELVVNVNLHLLVLEGRLGEFGKISSRLEMSEVDSRFEKVSTRFDGV